MIAYVFPGQGSQRKGMGEGLFEAFPDLVQKADAVLGYSIRELCIDDPQQNLNKTQYTQPALYTVNALSYLKKVSEGAKPDFLAGHSLGEYNALHASGAFSFEAGLSMVKKRGELMAQAKDGGMAAILNLSEDKIRDVLEKAELTGIDIANYNSPSQIIISGRKDEVAKSQPYFEKANAPFIPLNTSGAFHSRLMLQAGEGYGEFLRGFTFETMSIPVIANVTAQPYEQGRIAELLTSQISNSVRWSESVAYMLDQGVEEFLELGVGDVLTKLVAAIRKSRSGSDKAAAKPKAASRSKSATAKEKVAATPAPASESASAGTKAAGEVVQDWNRRFPIGTKVTSPLYDNLIMATRTEAMILFGHRAAVYMEGYNGYFDVRELMPVSP